MEAAEATAGVNTPHPLAIATAAAAPPVVVSTSRREEEDEAAINNGRFVRRLLRVVRLAEKAVTVVHVPTTTRKLVNNFIITGFVFRISSPSVLVLFRAVCLCLLSSSFTFGDV